MRNGDYTPTRMQSQADAVTILFNAKTQSNPENTVGLMTMAGKSPEVLVTLTENLGKILSAIHSVQISGTANFSTGVQIAQLGLKHRQNKNQRQRVVVFVGSPVEEDEKSLVKLAKKLKKNNIAVDVVNFGEETQNTAKLEAFINAVNSNDNSHLVTIPPGPHILSDVLISSPIISGEDGAPPGFAAGGGFEFGVDPTLDPDLALALRISLEEERARQEAAARAEGGGGGDKPEGEASAAMQVDSVGGTDEDEMLKQALQMSMGDRAQDGDVAMEDLTEEEQIARALEMSLQREEGQQGDADYMSDVLATLPGVDPNDPRVKEALQGMKEKREDSKK
ncbi:hypothetical protein BJ742DRAFT_826291 [Cladochytrium replicatum]|nr:hypothetical protein BJ742DRAFT_826291 [Cladochytrium replicatum]